MAGPGDRASTAAAPVLASLGLLAAVAAGSVWTGLAVADGRTGAVVVRFALSVTAAWYYLVLHRISRGRPALPGPRLP